MLATRVLDDILLNTGVLILYLGFVFLTFVALLLARWVKARGGIQIQAALLSPMGSLSMLTTAFLLSNVIF